MLCRGQSPDDCEAHTHQHLPGPPRREVANANCGSRQEIVDQRRPRTRIAAGRKSALLQSAIAVEGTCAGRSTVTERRPPAPLQSPPLPRQQAFHAVSFTFECSADYATDGHRGAEHGNSIRLLPVTCVTSRPDSLRMIPAVASGWPPYTARTSVRELGVSALPPKTAGTASGRRTATTPTAA